MKRTKLGILRITLAALAAVSSLLLSASGAKADSYSGTLLSAEDTFSLVFNVTGSTKSETVTAQTWGFGGGTNAAGTVIAPGGFDPFLGIFSGTGDSAAIVTDGSGNTYGTSDLLTNYGSFVGCPPAGTVNINGATCGDITMSLSLAPGTYTLLLSDAAYIPNAVFDNGTIGEGFADFTAGVFQTCDSSTGLICQNDTGNWAFDLTIGNQTVTRTPEPGALLSLLLSLSSLLIFARLRTGAHRALLAN